MTPWTSKLLDDANEFRAAGRHRAALGCILTVLSVYPDLDSALRLAASLAYLGTKADVAEPLTSADLCDPRLDSLFCSCQVPGCTYFWVSLGRILTGVTLTVMNPRGGRCERCDGYVCRHHFAGHGACPRCHGSLDYAPRVSNGRPAMQTVRFNRPLVHVQILREGTGRISPEYMTELLSSIAPDVFEDSPTIRGIPIHPWPDDCRGLAMAILCNEHEEYLGHTYDMRIADGRDRAGTHWALVKIFAKIPKYVDPDFSTDSG
jgi:hypothetical protein